MPLPTSLIASVVGAVIEAASSSSSAPPPDPQFYESYVVKRMLPPEAKYGVMRPPQGDGRIIIDGNEHPLSPVAHFRDSRNLIVLPMTIRENKEIVYINDPFGAVFRVWMVSRAELSALRKKN